MLSFKFFLVKLFVVRNTLTKTFRRFADLLSDFSLTLLNGQESVSMKMADLEQIIQSFGFNNA